MTASTPPRWRQRRSGHRARRRLAPAARLGSYPAVFWALAALLALASLSVLIAGAGVMKEE